MVAIIGIDPGSRVTGYGVISTAGSKLTCLTAGVVKTSTDSSLSIRLNEIFDQLTSVIQAYGPIEMSIEQVFMSQNADSALKLGQARGAAMLAGTQQGLVVYEYSARQAKQAVVGTGAAAKDQVALMVKRILNIKDNLPIDATDALGLAICHANTRQSLVKIANAKGFSTKRIKY